MKLKNLPLSKVLVYTGVSLLLLISLSVLGFSALRSQPSVAQQSTTTEQQPAAQSVSVTSQSVSDSSEVAEEPTVTASVSVEVSSDSASSQPQSDDQSIASAPPEDETVTVSGNVTDTAVPSDEYRGMWISYLELQQIDMSSEAAFSAAMSTMLDNCVATGLNTVIFHVRPFGDALYESSIFPTSHLVTGSQGTQAGYDPLQVVIELAKARGLRVEAWINPYRVQLTQNLPSSLSSSNPAIAYQNNPATDDYVVAANDGLYYNPAYPEVQQLIVDGVVEIVRNYDVDGVQFDDYFYPTTDASFDATAYSKLGGGMDLSAWRRNNVNTLVKSVYDAVKRTDPTTSFGISPQGNNDNNYNSQYSDVNLWLSTPGYVDYIMPQNYWGFDYLTASGRTDYQFVKLTQQWASYDRAPSVALYIGLGAFRIEVGDGGANDQAEWSTGDNLARQITALREINGIDGFALYRYDSLYNNPSALSDTENANITAVLN